MLRTLSKRYVNSPFSSQRLSRFIETTNRCKFSTEQTDNSPEGESSLKKLGGFAKAFQKHADELTVKVETPEIRSFASLLRSSKFIDLGDPEGKIVLGEIVQVVEDDLYIDFGWKFNCVCQRPSKGGEDYVRHAKVRVMIKDLELSSRFLGSDTDLTLLEADCRLLNLVYSPAKR